MTVRCTLSDDPTIPKAPLAPLSAERALRENWHGARSLWIPPGRTQPDLRSPPPEADYLTRGRARI